MITSAQIRAARALLGMDQRTLAERAGLSLPTIQRREASDGQVRGVVEAILTEGNPELAQEPVAMRRFADVVTRLLISYAVSAPDDPPEVVAHFLSTFLVHGAVASGTNLEATP